MSRYLAIEWDQSHVRVVAARAKLKQVTVEHAFQFDLPEDGDSASQSLGQRLADELSQRKIGRGETLVCVARSGVELRALEVPAAPPEELPDLVRFQALRQFANLGEDWAVDFVTLGSSEASGPIRVLAAGISPPLVEQIHQTCKPANLEPKHLLLRPFATVALLRHARVSDDRCCLAIDLLQGEADLTVLHEQQVGLTRTVKLPRDQANEDLAKWLVLEIRRTMAAFKNQNQGKEVQTIVACGTPDDFSHLSQHIEQQLGLPVEFYHPLDAVSTAASVRQVPPANIGRFTPLIGMLLDHVSGDTPAMDFLAPKRRPDPPSKKRRNVMIGILAASFLLALTAVGYLQLKSKQDAINQLTAERNLLLEPDKDATQRIREVDLIDQWVLGDVTWLDDLAELSQQFPVADDAIVDRMAFTIQKNNEAKIDFSGLAANPDSITKLERMIRDHDRYNDIRREGGIDRADSNLPYERKYREVITIEPKQLQ